MILNKIVELCSKGSENLSYVSKIASPIGNIIICADDATVLAIIFEDSKNVEKSFRVLAEKLNCTFIEKKYIILDKIEIELKLYFEGKIKKFTVPITKIGTDFQKEVWSQLMEIPYGSRQSYGDLAKDMGRSASHSRAVGAACGANFHLIVIPCHRIVAAGSMGGFSNGLDRKEWLLEHEKKFLN